MQWRKTTEPKSLRVTHTRAGCWPHSFSNLLVSHFCTCVRVCVLTEWLMHCAHRREAVWLSLLLRLCCVVFVCHQQTPPVARRVFTTLDLFAASWARIWSNDSGEPHCLSSFRMGPRFHSMHTDVHVLPFIFRARRHPLVILFVSLVTVSTQG